VLLPLYGGFAACTDGVGKAWVSALAPAEQQGWAQGLLQGALGGGVLAAGLWAGLAWHGDGAVPLVLAGAVGLTAAVLMLAAGRRLAPG
jgi:hypothetical protein